jgi:hypothetical protein
MKAMMLGKGKRKPTPSSANRLHSHLHSLFNWAAMSDPMRIFVAGAS